MNKKIQILLKKIEAQNVRESAWIVGPETGHMLYWLVRVWQPENIVEIGTSIGYSAIWMAAALEENGRGKIFTIESHKKRFEMSQKNIADSGISQRIIQIKGHAPEVFESDSTFSKKIDMAFFDATKQETQSFFDAVFPRMPVGGLIVVDNVQSHRYKSMLKFINAIHKDPRVEVVEIPVGAGLLLARKV